jgi:Epoxide hydrolase N terminus
LKRLVEYWIDGYDWRCAEREINSFHHYTTRIEGIPIHFIQEPGKGPRSDSDHHEPRMAVDVL